MIKIRKTYVNQNKTLILMLVALIGLFSVVSPLQTFCANEKIYTLSEDLNGTVIEELQEIDFSGFNEILNEFNEKNTNVFSIQNIKSKVYSISYFNRNTLF